LWWCSCVALQSCESAAKTPSGYDYDYDDSENDYRDTYSRNQHQQEMDYGGDVIKVTDAPLICYSCEFTILEDGHMEGYQNCNEPFSREDIPEIPCKQGACSVSAYRDRVRLTQLLYLYDHVLLLLLTQASFAL